MNDVVGIGVDLEPVASFRPPRRKKNDGLTRRVFSPAEIHYCGRFLDPAPHFAARFCAKEALVKAARAHAPLLITDAEVTNDSQGAPHLRPRSRRKEVTLFFQRYRVLVTLSHSDQNAIAFVVLCRPA